jgi:hypothetical protein
VKQSKSKVNKVSLREAVCLVADQVMRLSPDVRLYFSGRDISVFLGVAANMTLGRHAELRRHAQLEEVMRQVLSEDDHNELACAGFFEEVKRELKVRLRVKTDEELEAAFMDQQVESRPAGLKLVVTDHTAAGQRRGEFTQEKNRAN